MSIKAVEVIGSGASGDVYLGIYGDMKVALKKINSKENDVGRILKEIEILKLLKNTCENYVVKYEGDSSKDDDYVIMTSYLESYVTLSQFIKNTENFSKIIKSNNEGDIKKYKKIFKDLCKGLTYIHNAGVVHRDIKPANILISTANFQIKYIDFGYSKINTDVFDGDRCGTRKYMDPLIYKNKNTNYSFDMIKKSDIYSLNCIIYRIVSGRHTPFSTFLNLYDKNDDDLFKIFNLERLQKLETEQTQEKQETQETEEKEHDKVIFKIYSNVYTYENLIKLNKVKTTLDTLKEFFRICNFKCNVDDMFSENQTQRNYYYRK